MPGIHSAEVNVQCNFRLIYILKQHIFVTDFLSSCTVPFLRPQLYYIAMEFILLCYCYVLVAFVILLVNKVMILILCPLVQVFHRLVYQDKQESQGSNHVFGMGHSISILIRRSHLYEDAFEKLSSENGQAVIRQ